MSDITDNLHGVLQNLVRNRSAVKTNLDTVQKAVTQLDEESLASIKQLLAKWEHPQTIAQFVQAVGQETHLVKAIDEMDTAVAVLQAAADDDAFLIQAQAQLTANTAAVNSPLPAAGQIGESAPAAATSPQPSATPAVPAANS